MLTGIDRVQDQHVDGLGGPAMLDSTILNLGERKIEVTHLWCPVRRLRR
jgi:hypothetical protein